MLAATDAGAHSYQAGALTIGHPWAPPAPAGMPTAVGYLSVTNTGKALDRLVGATSPMVRRIEIRQSTTNEDVASAPEILGGLTIAPGQTVTLAPGAYQLTLIGPRQAFSPGDHIPATLRFAHAGKVDVFFLVQAPSPTAAQPMPAMPGT
ncbi:MAG TPA: copper chaperone PCu(A)C [Caulobacteraceae bacterium]|nr:copper chaperone PCu(A)C [Caulobacteraceae bacterium]